MKRSLDFGWFPVAYFLLAALSFNSLTAGRAFMTPLTWMIFFWGTVLLIYRLWNFRCYFSFPLLFGCFLFWLSYGISAMINFSYGVTGNLKALFWLGMELFILYPSSILLSRGERRIRMERLKKVLYLYTGVQAVISLGMLLLGYQGISVERGMYLGIQLGRLWGSYSDPNYGALLAISALVLMLGDLQEKKGEGWRKFLSIDIFLQYFYLVFSYSRGGQICLLAATFLLFFFWGKDARATRKKKILVGILVLFFCLPGPGIIRNVYNAVYAKTNVYAAEISQEEEQKETDLLHREAELSQDITNGRLSIWTDGIEIWKDNPVFGISYRNVSAYLEENYSDSYMNQKEVSLNTFHNLFMDVLVSQGIMGILLLCAMIMVLFWRQRKILFSLSREEKRQWIFFAVAAITIALGAMFVSDIFYINSPTSVLFWCILGYLAVFDKEEGIGYNDKQIFDILCLKQPGAGRAFRREKREKDDEPIQGIICIPTDDCQSGTQGTARQI